MNREVIAITAACGLVLLLGACSSAEERANVGYSDGYAVGYNTACQIRATLIEGDFRDRHYAEAYARRQTDGVTACNADRKAGHEE